MCNWILTFVALFGFFSKTSVAQSPQQIAPTPALSAEEQRAKFHLPPGFEIQLVVDETHIGQPMNLNFDAHGRLWISHSVEYPYPVAGEYVQPREERFGTASQHAPRDRVTVVEGIGENGRPRQIWDYETGLNIPIGLTPTHDGAIIYSIPNIVRYAGGLNVEGSQKLKQTLYGPFGNVDTHGMTNSFIRALDGWIYACHGFRNDTALSFGTEDSAGSLHLNSGSVYRFREDGSQAERFTWGQVNPFGLTFDEWGNLYSADCHSKPLTLLLRGAYYSSFGKPHDGLGFGPDMIDHSHGSTGICGPAYYAARHFPNEYRHNMFLCNPVNGRVHRDQLRDVGSTRLVESQPDFVTCDDPWFRPVDLKLGPDGALYLADFYNAIIGHYEVPLEHPSRDRTHGRVWRIVYRGDEPHEPAAFPANLAQHPERYLGHHNMTIRRLATNQVVDQQQHAQSQIVPTVQAEANEFARVSQLWIRFRLNQLTEEVLRNAARDDSPLVRTHLARVLAELNVWNETQRTIAETMLMDENPVVQRATADAIGRHPAASAVALLWQAFLTTDPADTHLKHTLRIALKSHFRESQVLRAFDVTTAEPASSEFVRILLAVPTASSAEKLAELALPPGVDQSAVAQHLLQYGSPATIMTFISQLRQAAAHDLLLQRKLLVQLIDGALNDQVQQSEQLRKWAMDAVLASLQDQQVSIQWQEDQAPRAWSTQVRPCEDGSPALLHSSFPLGEQGTGTLHSAEFPAPETLEFYIAGHRGFPDKPPHEKNRIVLRDAQTRQVLAEANPPRQDTAKKVTWDLQTHSGRRAYLELIDGDAGSAYAWFAVGRFSIPGLNPQGDEAAAAILQLISGYRLQELGPQLEELMHNKTSPMTQRLFGVQAWLAIHPHIELSALLHIAQRPGASRDLQNSVILFCGQSEDESILQALGKAVNLLSLNEQKGVVSILLSTKRGGETLLSLMENGKLSGQHLRQQTVREALLATHGDAMQARIDQLVSQLPQVADEREHRLRELLDSFASDTASAERGQQVFKKNCAICHKIGNEGNIVGPQLDGIGQRGVERLLQDILMPNLNVDGAFRVTTLALNDGRVLTGLLRNDSGPQRVFVDNQGKEFTVNDSLVESEKRSSLSLMPTNLTDNIPQNELHDLLAYLLSQQSR